MTATRQSHPPAITREQFCQHLRSRRDAARLSLGEIAKVTRIPLPSLERLEQGRFEELPGDVFVRGFLRSYANCVGLDAEATVRAYARCGLEPAPVSSELADEVLRQLREVEVDASASGTVVVVTGPANDEGRAARDQAVAPASADADAGDADADGADADAADDAADDRDDAGDGDANVEAEASASPAPTAKTAKPASRSRRRRRGKRKARARTHGSHDASHRRPQSRDGIAAERSRASSVADADSEASTAAAAPASTSSSTTTRAATATPSSTTTRAATATSTTTRAATSAGATTAAPQPAEAAATRPARQRTFLPPQFGDEDEGSRRGPLTLAVIILVIVATLTMSYLLRRPSSATEGFTALPTPPAETRSS